MLAQSFELCARAIEFEQIQNIRVNFQYTHDAFMDSIYKSAGEGTLSKATVGNTLDLNIALGSNGAQSGGRAPPAGATTGNA